MIRRYNRNTIEGAYLEIHRLNDTSIRAAAADNSSTRYLIENISRGGLRFESDDQFRIDERVEITVHLTSGKTHSAMGRICYRQLKNGNPARLCYGVSFLDNFLEMSAVL